ncbi:hypothetical protein [Salsuginibacillus halophilus]|nr:hypothetical protein [Salsuginibacillus halophilus]
MGNVIENTLKERRYISMHVHPKAAGRSGLEMSTLTAKNDPERRDYLSESQAHELHCDPQQLYATKRTFLRG